MGSNDGSLDPWSPLIPSASVVCEYLMVRYGWSLFKVLDFVNNRLMATIRTAQLLKEVNSNSRLR